MTWHILTTELGKVFGVIPGARVDTIIWGLPWLMFSQNKPRRKTEGLRTHCRHTNPSVLSWSLSSPAKVAKGWHIPCVVAGIHWSRITLQISQVYPIHHITGC